MKYTNYILGADVDYSGIELEVSNKNVIVKSPHIWKSSNILINSQWVKEKIIMNISKYFH